MPNRTFFSHGVSAFLFVGALAVVGCQRESGAGQRSDRNEPPNTPGYYDRGTGRSVDMDRPIDRGTVDRGTGIHAGESATAVSEISLARCARERACNNVGAGKKWGSDDACQSEISAKTRDDLNANDCPGGIDQKELNECLSDIQKEDCNSPLDTLSRLAACRTSDLCKALPR